MKLAGALSTVCASQLTDVSRTRWCVSNNTNFKRKKGGRQEERREGKEKERMKEKCQKTTYDHIIRANNAEAKILSVGKGQNLQQHV